jgi:uncharacterized membrane protein HdeD (DUF308 family)/alpha-beta hydrolase superfamily lysophospholipase
MQATESRRPPSDAPEHLPWWMQALLGAAMCALGVTLALDPGAALTKPGLLLGAGLVTAGLLRAANSQRAPLRHFELGIGIVVAASGLLALNWRDPSPRALAQIGAGALLAGGLANLVEAFLAPPGERIVAVLAGVATLLFPALVLSWPGLTLLALGAIVGGWFVFAGLAQVGSAILRRRRPHAPPPPEPAASARRQPVRLAGTLASFGLGAAVLGAGLLVQGTGVELAPDAFYDPPPAVPPRPGALVRLEVLATGIPAGARAWRMLYTTTNPDGSAALASGTVLAPALPDAGPRPVVAVAHGTTGIAPKCAPSLSKRPFGHGAEAALERMIDAGWVGVATDYVGLGTRGPHPYLVGESEARAVLDAVRAARAIPSLALAPRVAVWGHSEGGHGALWTGIVAPRYAPELRILGVAAMAPPSDLAALAAATPGTTAGKLVLAYLAASWAQVYPGLDLARLVTPGTLAVVARLGELCFDGRDALAAAAASEQLLDTIFRPDALGGRFGLLLRANSPTGTIAAPLLIAQGAADQLVSPAAQARFVALRCAAGQPLEYRVYPGLDHLPLIAPGSPLTTELVAWTLARLAGEAPKSSC